MRRTVVVAAGWLLAFVAVTTLALASEAGSPGLDSRDRFANSALPSDQDVLDQDSLSIDAMWPDPQTVSQCRQGGWQDYGFHNQGQCLRFVLTGMDGRQ